MIARVDAARSRSSIAIRHRLSAAVLVGLLIWLAIIVVRGAVLVLQSSGFPIAGEAQRSYATPQMVWAAVLVCLSCLLAALITRWVRPAMTQPVTYAIGGGIVLTGAVLTGSVGSLLTVLAMASLSLLVGDVLLRRLPPAVDVPVVRLPIAIASGLAILGLLLFLLATLRVLNAVTVLGAGGGILLLLLVLDRERFRTECLRLASWRPAAPNRFETVVLGISVGLLAFALLAAFVPENASDAMRQHLPIAREIWQTGSAPEFPPMGVSRDPIQGHLLYAVAYGFGGMTAAKLVHSLVGLAAIVGVAGIGWLCSGRLAATIGAAILATMPVMLWLLGHAFLDLFPVMFTVAAVLCLLLWQRDGQLGWALCAGALAGVGFTAKLTMALMIVALAVAIVLVGRGLGWRERLPAVMAFGLGATVVVPWLLRSYVMSGSMPGLSPFIERLAGALPSLKLPVEHVGAQEMTRGVDGSTGPALSALPDLASDHSLLDVPRGLWDLTFHAEQFGFPIIGRGEIGIVLLLLLPLALFGPRNRSTAFLAVTAVVSYLGWWLTPYQIARHLLPALAIAAALSGIGVASLIRAGMSGTRNMLATAAQVGIVAGCVAAAVLFLHAERTRLPVNLIIGRETATEYIAREIPMAEAAEAASAQLPPDTLVGYIGSEWEGAQIYTEARLEMNFAAAQLGSTADEVLDSLDGQRIDYFIWNRPSTDLADWRSTLLSMSFLREHTRILDGDDGGYLFEIRAGEGAGWDMQAANLLEDPELDRIGDDGPWTTVGRVRGRRGVISMQLKSSIAQRVSIEGDRPYLLVASGQCPKPEDRADLVLRWFDDNEVELGADVERVFPGIDRSDQFLWHRAPERATSVSAELTESKCEFGRIGLYPSS